MRVVSLCSLLISSYHVGNSFSFTSLPRSGYRTHRNDVSVLLSSASDEERRREIFQQEAMNPANMKASSDMMKNMKPEDIDKMCEEMDRMPASQLQQMKDMGMNVDMMKSTMQMMKSNPAMMESMSDMMSKMSPEELLEQSRVSQQMMQQQGVEVPGMQTPKVATNEVIEAELESDDEDDEDEKIICDPKVLDAMYLVAEIMSEPQIASGGITFEAFTTVPPVSVLLNEGDEDSLTVEELKECWDKGSSGGNRVDRAGFERVWIELQDEYYNDIVEEAREKVHIKTGKKKRGTPKASTSAPPATTATPVASTTTPLVGQNVDPNAISAQLKSMSDGDITSMFDQMSEMTPAQEASMKAMGVDPEMMKKSAQMFANNPLMGKAAAAMMKNTSPDQMMKASQQAQEKLKSMTDEERKKLMESMGKK